MALAQGVAHFGHSCLTKSWDRLNHLAIALAVHIHQLTEALNAILLQRALYPFAQPQPVDGLTVQLGGEEHPNRMAQTQFTHAMHIFRLFHTAEDRQFRIGAILMLFYGHVIDAHDHIFGRANDRLAAAGLEQVVLHHRLP